MTGSCEGWQDSLESTPGVCGFELDWEENLYLSGGGIYFEAQGIENRESMFEKPLFLRDVGQYEGDELRMKGMKLGRQAAENRKSQILLPMPEQIAIFTDEMYRVCKANGGVIPEEVKVQYNDEIAKVLAFGEGIGVRRAYRRGSNGNGRYLDGPTFNNLETEEQVWEGVEAILGYAMEHHDKNLEPGEETEFAAMFYKWIDPIMPPGRKIGLHELTPAGCQAFVEYVDSERTVCVRVESVLGDQAAVTLGRITNQVDRHFVHVRADGTVEELREAHVNYKDSIFLQRRNEPDYDGVEMLVEGGGKDSSWYRVPLHTIGDRRALWYEDIKRAAVMVDELYRMTGQTYKIEASLGKVNENLNAIFFNEITPFPPQYELGELGKEVVEVEGKLELIVSNMAGVKYLEEELLQKWQAEGLQEERVVMLGSDITTGASALNEETTRLINRLKRCPVPLRIFYAGRFNEHKLRQLIERNSIHQAFPVELGGTLDLRSGDFVRISRLGGTYFVGALEMAGAGQEVRQPTMPMIMTIEEILRHKIANESVLGGKLLPLLTLASEGYLIPDTFLVTDRLLKEVLKDHDPKLLSRLENLDQVKGRREFVALFGEVKQVFENMLQTGPVASEMPKLWKRARNALKVRFGNGRLGHLSIWRSNFRGEDDPRHSFAGKAKSVPRVRFVRKDMDRAWLTVVSSYFERHIAEEIWELPLKERGEMLRSMGWPVLGHEMIECEGPEGGCSGAVFTRDQTGKRRDNLLIISADLGNGGTVEGLAGMREGERRRNITIEYDRNISRFNAVRIEEIEKRGEETVVVETQVLSHDEYILLNEKKAKRAEIVMFPKEAKEAIRLALRAEKILKQAQDMEFAIGLGRRGFGYYTVQSRGL